MILQKEVDPEKHLEHEENKAKKEEDSLLIYISRIMSGTFPSRHFSIWTKWHYYFLDQKNIQEIV